MATHWIVEIISVMFLIPTREFGGTEMMKIPLKLVNLPKWVYIGEGHKKSPKKVMSGSTDVFFLNIRTIHLKKYRYIFFNTSPTCPKSVI